MALAIKRFCRIEKLEVFRNDAKELVDATKQTTFIKLPPILVINFKYFGSKTGNSAKLKKIMPLETKIKVSKQNYELFAIIFHFGESIHGGHYETEAFHSEKWHLYSDQDVKVISSPSFTSNDKTRVPYLLFYKHEYLQAV